MTGEWGLAALGQSGPFLFELLEPLHAGALWLLTLDVHPLELDIVISGPEVIRELIRFFEPSSLETEMAVGRCLGETAVLRRDREVPGRFFLAVIGSGRLELTITGVNMQDCLGALRDLAADMATV